MPAAGRTVDGPVPDDDPLLDVLRRFARAMARGYDLADILHEFCEHAAEVVGADAAGVALLDGDKLRFVTATNATAVAAEHAQEEHQAGPCLASIHDRRPVPVADLRDHTDDWPAYCADVLGHGVHAVLGIPLILDDERIGSLDVYQRAPREWSDAEINSATVLADIAAAYVLNASELARTQRTAEQLQHALDSRVVIEQAKGVVAAKRELPVDEAFRLIRQHARSNNRTVREVALGVLDDTIDVTTL